MNKETYKVTGDEFDLLFPYKLRHELDKVNDSHCFIASMLSMNVCIYRMRDFKVQMFSLHLCVFSVHVSLVDKHENMFDLSYSSYLLYILNIE